MDKCLSFIYFHDFLISLSALSGTLDGFDSELFDVYTEFNSELALLLDFNKAICCKLRSIFGRCCFKFGFFFNKFAIVLGEAESKLCKDSDEEYIFDGSEFELEVGLVDCGLGGTSATNDELLNLEAEEEEDGPLDDLNPFEEE